MILHNTTHYATSYPMPLNTAHKININTLLMMKAEVDGYIDACL